MSRQALQKLANIHLQDLMKCWGSQRETSAEATRDRQELFFMTGLTKVLSDQK